MSGVLNDYNQLEGDPRIRIGNWVEERALMSQTGQSRGSTTAQRNNTGPRITGPIYEPLDYGTTTNLAHEHALRAPHGPNFVASIAPPRRGARREDARQAEAEAIMAEKLRLEEERRLAEIHDAAFGSRAPQNRKRAIVTGKPLDASVRDNPIDAQAITFHTHHLGQIHGTTPTDRGVHTFSRNTHFSKPIDELYESGER